MNPITLGGIALTTLALAGLVVAEYREARGARVVTKLLASTGFLVCAIGVGATGSTYGLLILAALALSWVGDALLLSHQQGIFMGGLVAFLLAHLAYCGAFWHLGVDLPWVAGGAGAVAVMAVPILRWLLPHLEGLMKTAVLAYVVVISVMVALAVGTFGAGHPWILVLGAVIFFLSDLAVARERFVTPGFVNQGIGLPLYFGAQLLLALTAGLGTAAI